MTDTDPTIRQLQNRTKGTSATTTDDDVDRRPLPTTLPTRGLDGLWTRLVVWLIELFNPVEEEERSAPDWHHPWRTSRLRYFIPKQIKKEQSYWQVIEEEAYDWKHLKDAIQTEGIKLQNLSSKTPNMMVCTINGNGGSGKTTVSACFAQAEAVHTERDPAFVVANPNPSWNSIQAVGMHVEDAPTVVLDMLSDAEIADGWGRLTGTGEDFAKMFFPDGFNEDPADVPYTEVRQLVRRNPYGLSGIGPWKKRSVMKGGIHPSGIMMRSIVPILRDYYSPIIMDGGNQEVSDPDNKWTYEMVNNADGLIFTAMANELKSLQEVESNMFEIRENGFEHLVDNSVVVIAQRSPNDNFDLEQIRQDHFPSFDGPVRCISYDPHIQASMTIKWHELQLQTQYEILHGWNTTLQKVRKLRAFHHDLNQTRTPVDSSLEPETVLLDFESGRQASEDSPPTTARAALGLN